MAFNNSIVFLFSLLILALPACTPCEGDEFGLYLKLEVPIQTLPAQDTLRVGDTLWIEANIDKEVAVRNRNSTIRLDSFNFFTEMILSEISDSTENFLRQVTIIEDIGQVKELFLPTAFVRPLFFEEEPEAYRFRAGIILQESGRYYLAFSTSSSLYERYDHPAMYLCENERRWSTEVFYQNPSTTLTAYEAIFLETGVEYLIELMDYAGYQSTGAHTFMVVE